MEKKYYAIKQLTRAEKERLMNEKKMEEYAAIHSFTKGKYDKSVHL